MNDSSHSTPIEDDSKRLRRPALACAAAAAIMFGASFAAAPLYEVFCRITGYGGETQVVSLVALDEATAPLGTAIPVAVRFDANVDPELPWDFAPEVRRIKTRLGESRDVVYVAANRASEPTRGMATFNVTPHVAGAYFQKTECFCFTEQVLAAGESVRMPVAFRIDPAIADDPDAQGVAEITLSYTFYPLAESDDTE